ncbi:hypothetical protein F5880DRAFT_1494355 [Lentinula raphanica]|nr:hypothetical protein F5880DRAFT_1494355 [Lentinula raphanica]
MYMDDFFGWDFAENLVFFHGQWRPRRQVQLLLFWDVIRCPYEDLKQDAGSCLKIIGFLIDINAGTISITDESITELLSCIRIFLNHSSRKPPLRDWLRLCGHINWALNVLPWGQPALSELYSKISDKTGMRSGVPINVAVREGLSCS